MKLIRLIIGLFSKKYKNIMWRNNNKHNQTWIGNVQNVSCFSVGNMSWGELNTIDYLPQKSMQCKISIGHFCSIAGETFFMRGGEHRTDRISTFLFKSCYNIGKEDNLKTSNDIVVNDDVWIGYGCLILPGTVIGQGSVIGARSVVRGIVPPYSIYIGDRVVKKRFDTTLIELLKKIDYSVLTNDKVNDILDLLYSPVSEESINEMIYKLGRKEKE